MSVIETAMEAAKAAGGLIREKAHAAKKVATKSSAYDLVTEVDKQSEEIIRQIISKHYPDHAILGEEGDPSDSAAADGREYVWIVDLIDGTTNFVHGVPFFCVSIGVTRRNQVVAGVIYDPMRDELFSAVKQEGACLNGKPIRVSAEKSIAESLLATDFPAIEYRQAIANGIAWLSPLCRSIRTPGSAALELAYVAAGRYSGYWELGLKPWDLAAGVLLVEESGGRVSDTLGHPLSIDNGHVAATNGFIHDELITLLKAANATGF